jgi:hypothetical protein
MQVHTVYNSLWFVQRGSTAPLFFFTACLKSGGLLPSKRSLPLYSVSFRHCVDHTSGFGTSSLPALTSSSSSAVAISMTSFSMPSPHNGEPTSWSLSAEVSTGMSENQSPSPDTADSGAQWNCVNSSSIKMPQPHLASLDVKDSTVAEDTLRRPRENVRVDYGRNDDPFGRRCA